MFIKQSTAYDFRMGPFLDETDGKTAETGLTLSQADYRLSKAGGNFASKNESTSGVHDELGYYISKLDTTDTNTCGELLVAVHESGALPVFKTFQVVEEAIYAALFAASATGELLVDVAKISGDATAANNLELMYDGTGYAGGTAKLGVDVVKVSGDSTAADNLESMYDGTGYVGGTAKLTVDVAKVSGDSTAADNMELMFDGTGYAGGSTKLAVNTTLIEGSDATDQINAACDASIVTYNLDHLMHTAVASNANMTTEVPDGTVLSNLMTKTGDTSDYAYATDSMEALGEDTDSIISKVDVVDGIVDNILVDTAVIGSAGAGLTAVPWNSAWDAEVQSEVADGLAAYDPPTKAEMDAMWTTAQTESYASDGAAATPAQLLYMILCAVSEFSISSTTITGKKVDGSTTAMTWTLNDATDPTSRTRAS